MFLNLENICEGYSHLDVCFQIGTVCLQKIALGLHQTVCSVAPEWIDWMKCMISEHNVYIINKQTRTNKTIYVPLLPF